MVLALALTACPGERHSTTPVAAIQSPPASALSVSQALALPEGASESIEIVAYLESQPSDCHCPPDTPCAECPVPYAMFTDRRESNAADQRFYADLDASTGALTLGAQYVLTGSWRSEILFDHMERVFTVAHIASLP